MRRTPRSGAGPRARLRKAGFVRQAARGSHRKWSHPSGKLVIVSGSEGDDAKKYQEIQIEDAIASVQRPSKP
jgi:HicA toxin of bacterial toxin-antitoxin,